MYYEAILFHIKSNRQIFQEIVTYVPVMLSTSYLFASRFPLNPRQKKTPVLLSYYVLFIRSLIVHSFVRSFVPSVVRSFVHSLVNSFTHTFIRSFIHRVAISTVMMLG